VTARLVALDLAGGPEFVDALQRVWDAGDTAFPLDRRLPDSARADVVRRFGVAAIVTSGGVVTELPGGWATEPGDALVVATSGSSGVSKGVVLTHAAVAASASATSRRIGDQPDDRWLACLPLSHVGGLAVVTRALHTGTPLIVHDGFDAAAVASSGATLVSLVTTALRRIDPAAFRVIVLGGAAPPEERPANTIVTYGMTETGSGIVYDGVPLDGVEVRVVEGELHVRGPMLLRSYRDGSNPLLPGGWLPTGDLGSIDGGLVQVAGRAADLIITGGENVWPEAVEAVLRSHPAVADVGVVGVPDPEWGHRITAFVVVEPGAAAPRLDELREYARSGLAGYQLPRQVVVVDRLPRTALGKLRRSDLAGVLG
jgi:O-succinylbenzoic acid--CoA ligase